LTVNSNDYGIEFNGQRSTEFGLEVIYPKEIGLPAKTKILQTLPYSNTVLDLSELYGGQPYGERTIKLAFNVYQFGRVNKDRLYITFTKVVNWLMAPNHKVKLKDDVMSDYYYLGEVRSAPTFAEVLRYGTLTVEFTCSPFRIHELAEGADVWDEFNFELDVAQEVNYQVNGNRTITLINSGQPATCTVNVTSNLSLSNFGVLSAGTNAITLPAGETVLAITGNGQITFNWHKEVI